MAVHSSVHIFSYFYEYCVKEIQVNTSLFLTCIWVHVKLVKYSARWEEWARNVCIARGILPDSDEAETVGEEAFEELWEDEEALKQQLFDAPEIPEECVEPPTAPPVSLRGRTVQVSAPNTLVL